MQAGEEPVTPTWEEVTPAWEEARPPHLPDRITAIPRGVWPFVGITVFLIYLQIRRSVGLQLDAPNLVSFGLGLTSLAATTLLGAALFLRHPDAWPRLRPVAIGVALLAVAAALGVLAPVAQDLVGDAWIDSEGIPVLTVTIGVHRVGAIFGIFGVAALWVGLRRARRSLDPAWTRAILAVLLIAGLITLLLGYARMIQLGVFGEGLVALSNALVIVSDAIDLVAWVAVASILVAGARVSERPAAAWRLGALAAIGIIVAREPISWLLPLADAATPGLPTGYWIWVGIATAAAVLLLAAFLLGLPTPTESEATEPA